MISQIVQPKNRFYDVSAPRSCERGSEGQRPSDPSQVRSYLSSTLSSLLPNAADMTKLIERRPIESVTASVASRPKVREAEALSRVWSMSPHAEALSGVVTQATIHHRRRDRQSDDDGAGSSPTE